MNRLFAIFYSFDIVIANDKSFRSIERYFLPNTNKNWFDEKIHKVQFELNSIDLFTGSSDHKQSNV